MTNTNTLIKTITLGALLIGSPAWADILDTDPSPEIELRDDTANETDWGICVDNSGSCVTGTEPLNQHLHIGNDNDGGFGAAIGLEIEPGAGSTSTPLLHLDNTERVGIKTRNPLRDLHVGGGQVQLDPSGTAGDWHINPGGSGLWFRNVDGSTTTPVKFNNNAPNDSLVIQNGSGDVGIGTSNPDFALHVRRNNGTAQAKITEDQATTAVKTLFSLVCTTCTPGFRFANNGTGQIWFFRMLQNGDFSVDDPNTAAKEATFKSGGNLTIGGILTQGSSREIKHDIETVNTMDILDKVDSLEISEWTYNHHAGVRHMGPMAEDFYQAFKLGHTRKGLSAVDTSGVALAAIKALNSKLKATQADLLDKDSQIAELQQRMADMEIQVAEVQDLKEMLVKYIEQDTNTEFSHVSF